MSSRTLVLPCVAALALALSAPARAHAPHDLATAVAMSPDFANDQLVFGQFHLIDQRVFGRSTDGGDTWQELGLPMAERTVLEFQFSPDFVNDATAFAVTDSGGVYRTRDRGLTWHTVNNGLGSLNVRDVALSPDFANDGVLLVTTSQGVWRSADEGDSWSDVSAGINETNMFSVTIAPDDPLRCYAGGTNVHGSTDGGLTWSLLRAFNDSIFEIACSPTHSVDGQVAMAFRQTGILMSNSFGTGWQAWSAGLSEDQLLDIDVAGDGTWFASGRDEGPFLADGFGLSWRLENTGIEPWDETTQNHYREVRPSPAWATDQTAFLCTTEGIYVTRDGGDTWVGQDIFHQRIHVRLLASPDFGTDGEVYTANYGGGVYVWREPEPSVADGRPEGELVAVTGASSGVGASGPGAGSGSGPLEGPAPTLPPLDAPVLPGWEERASGIKSMWTDSIALSPTLAADHTVFQSYVGLHRSEDRGRSWTTLTLPPGVIIVRDMVLSPDYVHDRELYIGTNGVGTFRSDDGGDTWVDVSAGLPAGFRTRRLLLSPDYVNDRTVLATSWDHGLWISPDAGATWEERNEGLAQLNIQSFAMSPDFHVDGTLLAGTKILGLHMTTDAGLSWQLVSDSFDLSDHFVTSGVAFSPEWSRDGTAFATTLSGGIHRTTDGGQSWHLADAGFGWTAARDVSVSNDFGRDGTLFVSSHDNVWRSTDRGESWHPLPPFVRVDDRHPNVVAAGAWTYVDVPAVNGRGVSGSIVAGATRSLRFFGRSLRWHALRTPDSGLAEVRVDGVLADVVDLYAPADEAAAVFGRDFAEPGWHDVTVTVTGTSHPSSSDVAVYTDGFSTL